MNLTRQGFSEMLKILKSSNLPIRKLNVCTFYTNGAKVDFSLTNPAVLPKNEQEV